MSSVRVIRLDTKELRKLLSDPYSHIILQENVKHQVALTPKCLIDTTAAIIAILDRDLMIYDPRYKGVVLSYKNIRRCQNIGAIEGDNCHILIDLVLDIYIFAPTVGCTLRGVVNKKSPDGVGCLVHKGFNVAIPRPWGGTNHDWPGNFLEIGQDVMLQVEVLNFGKALPYIRGKLITDEPSSIQIHKKKKKKSKHKLQPLESEPSEVREDSARIQDNLPQKKKDKDKLGLENMIDFSSISNEVLTSPKKERKMKSKHKLHPIEGESTEVRGDLALTDGASPLHNKNKIELDPVIDFSSITHEVSATQKEKKKKKSKHKLHSIEGDFTEVRGDLALTEGTSPLHNKNKIELDPVIDFSSITHEVSATQKEKKKKKSKHKLHSIEGELTEVRSDLPLTEKIPCQKKKSKAKSALEPVVGFCGTTHEISANQKVKKTKDKVENVATGESLLPKIFNETSLSTFIGDISLNQKKRYLKEELKIEQSLLPGMSNNFLPLSDSILPVQMKKKKSRDKHSDLLDQSLQPTNSNDFLTTVTGEINIPLATTKDQKSKNKFDLEQCFLPKTSNNVPTDEMLHTRKSKKSKDKLTTEQRLTQNTNRPNDFLDAVDELPLVQMEKKKKKSKDRFEVELIKPSVTANYLQLSTQDRTKHSDAVPISRSIPTIFTGDASVGDLSTPTRKRKQVEALPYAVGIQEKEHRKKRSKHVPVGDTIQSTTGGHKSKSSESTPNDVECDATEDLERTLLKQSISKTKLNSTNNQPGSTHPSLKSTNQVTSSSSSSSDGEFTVPKRNQPDSLKTSVGLVMNNFTSNLQTTAQSSSSSSEDDVPMPSIPKRNQPDSLKPSIRPVMNKFTSNLKTTTQSSSSSSEDDVPIPSVPKRNQPDSLKPSIGLVMNNFTSNLQTTAQSSSSSSDDDVPMPSIQKSNQPDSLKPSIGLIMNNFTSNLQTTAHSSSSSSEDDVPMPSVPIRNQQESKKTNLPTRVHSSSSSTNDEIPKTKQADKKTIATSKKKSRNSNLPTLAVSSKHTAHVSGDLATQLLDDFILKMKSK